jgi:hypothetical protein
MKELHKKGSERSLNAAPANYWTAVFFNAASRRDANIFSRHTGSAHLSAIAGRGLQSLYGPRFLPVAARDFFNRVSALTMRPLDDADRLALTSGSAFVAAYRALNSGVDFAARIAAERCSRAPGSFHARVMCADLFALTAGREFASDTAAACLAFVSGLLRATDNATI